MDPGVVSGHPVNEFVVIIPETHNISCTPTSDTKRESRNRLSNSRMNSTEERSQTMPYHLWHNSMTSNLTIGGQTSVLVTSIGCLVVVNTYLKMLHETIKKLLNIVLIHNILTSGIVAALMTYMMTTHSQDFMICSTWLLAGSNAFVTRFGMALMSFSRYHITWKISKCESTKKISKHMVIAMVFYEQQRTPKRQIESYPSTSSNNIRLIDVKPNIMQDEECYM